MMLARSSLALALGLSFVLATTGLGEAARGPDATPVGLGTFAVAVGFLVFLSIVYSVKRALGLVKPPPPPEEAGAGGHH